MKIVPVPRTMTVSSLIAGTYAPPAVHEPITDGDLRDALRRHPRLVVEDPAEVVAVGEDLGLQRQEGAAGVDEVDARQPVLLGDLLRAQVLLDREREVRAALDGRVVGDDHALLPLDDADAGDDARADGASPSYMSQAASARELEERRARVDEPVDPLARRQLAARAVPLERPLAAAARDLRRALAQLGDELLHPRPAARRRRPSPRSTCEVSTATAVSLPGAPARAVLRIDDADPSFFGLFVLAALALLAVPGPAVLYVVSQSIEGGPRAGLLSTLGIHLGTLVHVAAAAIGLSSLLVSSAEAFDVVKYAGAAYLVFIGARTLLGRTADGARAGGGAVPRPGVAPGGHRADPQPEPTPPSSSSRSCRSSSTRTPGRRVSRSSSSG